MSERYDIIIHEKTGSRTEFMRVDSQRVGEVVDSQLDDIVEQITIRPAIAHD